MACCFIYLSGISWQEGLYSIIKSIVANIQFSKSAIRLTSKQAVLPIDIFGKFWRLSYRSVLDYMVRIIPD
ncbi:MAG: hypothetical protein DRJ13_10815 [Bacteroidetes bacterium]|nr:MAG: hypothetical protein DRJ13_10815 [Bacteroidota bacterium]